MTRVESVRLTDSSVPLHTPFVTALRRTETVDTLIVRVRDSDGRTGWGEAPQVWQVTGESLAGARSCIETMLAPGVVGHRLDDAADAQHGEDRDKHDLAEKDGRGVRPLSPGKPEDRDAAHEGSEREDENRARGEERASDVSLCGEVAEGDEVPGLHCRERADLTERPRIKQSGDEGE